jgi:hypothetical protein
LLLLLLLAATAPARAADEPGMDDALDEPGMTPAVVAADAALRVAPTAGPWLRVDLAFGLSSLLEDPDVGVGYGGGLSVVYGLHTRLGAELSVYVANNAYQGSLASLGGFPSFLAGNISLGPVVQLTRPGARLSVTAELLLGAYVIAPPVPVQDLVWTLGFGGGGTLFFRITGWLGVGFKVRYHVFNVASIAGPELVDRKAFTTIGVIDRFEVPGYVAICF